jgi:hypothetical protein
MPSSKRTTESAIAAYLQGEKTGDDRLDALLDAIAAVPSAPDHRDDLITRIATATGEAASTLPTGVRAPGSKPLPPRWRRRAAFSTILSSIAGKIALAGVALASTTGGLAAADALPDPAQQIVSDVAERIGISLPAPADHPSNAATDEFEEGAEADAPELPEQASSTAKRVIEIVFGGDPAFEWAEFGRQVADSASDGKSQGGNDDPGPPDDVPDGPPDQIPAGPPSESGGTTPASPSSPRP